MNYWREAPPIKDWEDVINLTGKYRKKKEKEKKEQWIFRGLRNYKYTLESTLDRRIKNINEQYGKNSPKEILPPDRWKFEAYLLYQFKRRAHFYLNNELPKPGEFLEWFSLMRHYGSPSRMIDFTYSFYIALYFAVFEEGENDACIFGINNRWLKGNVEEFVGNTPKTPDLEKKYFQTPSVFYEYAIKDSAFGDMSKPKPFVIPVRPFISNERIHLQQGLFLCPTNVSETFENNLMNADKPKKLERNIIKIRILKNAIPEIIRELKKMNISSETLFPGLGGFASSLFELLYTPVDHLTEGRLMQSIKENPDPEY